MNRTMNAGLNWSADRSERVLASALKKSRSRRQRRTTIRLGMSALAVAGGMMLFIKLSSAGVRADFPRDESAAMSSQETAVHQSGLLAHTDLLDAGSLTD